MPRRGIAHLPARRDPYRPQAPWTPEVAGLLRELHDACGGDTRSPMTSSPSSRRPTAAAPPEAGGTRCARTALAGYRPASPTVHWSASSTSPGTAAITPSCSTQRPVPTTSVAGSDPRSSASPPTEPETSDANGGTSTSIPSTAAALEASAASRPWRSAPRRYGAALPSRPNPWSHRRRWGTGVPRGRTREYGTVFGGYECRACGPRAAQVRIRISMGQSRATAAASRVGTSAPRPEVKLTPSRSRCRPGGLERQTGP